MGTNSHEWSRRFWQVFLGVLAFRLFYVAVFPFDFAGDEAYYWDWGRRLDWGYYSKPPMVAWLMALAGTIGNNNYFVIKLVPLLLTAGGVLTLFLLTCRLYGERAAFWTGVVLLALPATAALSILLTIDPPLFLFWSLSLLLTWRWLNGEGGWANSVALAVVLGAGYLSKPIQLLFPLMLLVFLALSSTDRRHLRRPGLYAVLVGSLLFLLPVVYWNQQHDWITFAHTAYHFEKPDLRVGKLIARPLEFAGSQIALCSPVLWFLLVAVVMAVALRWKQVTRREHFLFCFSGPMLAAVYLMSCWQRVHPNWPLVFYLAALVLLGGWAFAEVRLGDRLARWRRAFRPGVWIAVTLSALMYWATFAIEWTPLAGAKGDPTERLRGWRQLGQEVGQVLEGFPDPDRTLVIVASRRQVASQLAYYLPGQPRVYRLEDPSRINSQYGIWGGPQGKQGWDALVVMESRQPSQPPAELIETFETLVPLKPVEVPLGRSGAMRTVQLWLGSGFRQWPYPLSEDIQSR